MTKSPTNPIDPGARAALIAAIGVGARLFIACGYAKLDPSAVRRLLKADLELAKEVFEAQCRHQVRNLLKLERSGQVQSAIFALERRWPGRFARPKPQERPAPKNRPLPIDLSDVPSDVLERFERALNAVRSG